MRTIALRFSITALIVLFCTIACEAQDPHYTQFYANQPLLNPAFTGAGAGPRVSLNFRAQWVAIPGAYRQTALAYDQRVWLGRTEHGLGVLLHSDIAGEGNLSKTDILFQYAYGIQFGRQRSPHYIRLGLSGGIQQTNIQFHKLRFSDQIDPELGFVNATSEVAPPPRFKEDVNAGIAYYNKFAWVAFSVHHITQPNQAWLNPFATDARLPMRFTGTGGVRIPAGPMNNPEKVVISPAFLFMQQRRFNQLALGSYLEIQPLVLGLWYRMNFNNGAGQFLQSDMIAALVGFKRGIFSIGYSYDFTISRLTNGISGGSHEIALVLEFEQSKKSKFKHRDTPCPRF